MMSTSDLSDDEVVPASPASVELENVNFPMAMLNIDFDKENAKKKRLRKNAQNSKSNLIRGVCKKALGLTINPRMDLDAFVLVRDNESKSVTIVGSEEFMSNFKENKCLMACSQKKIFTYNLDQLNLVKKPAVPPSPQNLPKEMASFTPGSQQVYNLQNAALTRGASPLINITSDNSRNINSGIVGRVSAKRKALIPAPQKVSKPTKGKRRLIECEPDPVETLLGMIESLPPQEKVIVELVNGEHDTNEPEEALPFEQQALSDDENNSLEVEEVEERHFNTNEWVAVIYDWEFWPALIEEETEQGLFTLKFLEPISTNKFKEHDKKDKLATPEILCKLPNPPLPISNRHWALPSDDYKLINEKMKAILEL